MNADTILKLASNFYSFANEHDNKVIRFRKTISNREFYSKLRTLVDSSPPIDYFDYDHEGELLIYTGVYLQNDGTLADRPDPDFSDEDDF